MMLAQKDIVLKLEQLEKEMLKQNNKSNKQDAEIQIIFDALKHLLNPQTLPMEPIGFKTK